MDFLWFIPVLGFIFILKLQFPIHLFNFKLHWTGHQIQGRTGASAYNILRLRMLCSGWRVLIYNSRGVLLQSYMVERVSSDIGRPIWNEAPRLDPWRRESVRNVVHRITILRRRSNCFPRATRSIRSDINGQRESDWSVVRLLIWVVRMETNGGQVAPNPQANAAALPTRPRRRPWPEKSPRGTNASTLKGVGATRS
jgi:hypothetical protein